MGWKASLIRPYARWMEKRIRAWAEQPVEGQQKVFKQLINKGQHTAFGRAHKLGQISSYQEFTQAVPLGDYEQMRPWVDRICAGEKDVIWPGKPAYFAKTSGTTSGTKLIPISKDSLPYHVGSARNAVFCYVAETGNAAAFDGRMIFLSGSPELEERHGIPTGRLSGIVNHHIPSYVKKNQLPSWEVNCIEDWETKLEAILKETQGQDLRLIGGIPSWVQMYFDRLLEISGKTNVKEVFPNLQLYVYGGVNYAPYRARFEAALGAGVHTIETYPASEGFIAFQDRQDQEGLLLQSHAGIFYEFVELSRLMEPNPPRISLSEVQIGVNYAIVLNTNAGLWGYLIGDTVRFVSLSPYRILVTGRTKHFISAFGEHVISEEVDGAIEQALLRHGGQVVEFHVAPCVSPKEGGLPYHEWWVEFEQEPAHLEAFCAEIDQALSTRNSYYKDLIEGKILRPMVLRKVAQGGFQRYMKSIDKLGGQNKVPRLADNRLLADALEKELSSE